jgi:acyl-CoA reductase-like NAD-dependent aldehyde dehydrogenase
MSRIGVLKTYKLFINGEFPRTESGRYTEVRDVKGRLLANICAASRKDFRNAVVAARSAFPGWSARSAANRSQILYRLAEMVEARADQFRSELKQQGMSANEVGEDLEIAVDRLVYYAGWCDKFQQLFSAVNPVASAHYNFSVPEPTGVVSIIAPESGLAGLTGAIAPVICGGNSCIVLASAAYPLSAITFAEAIATSDVPPGVVNILTGSSPELHPHFSSHMDVNAIVYCRNDKKEMKTIMQNCSLNVKRFFSWSRKWSSPEGQDPYLIMDLQEIKTTWHPVERIGGGSTKY